MSKEQENQLITTARQEASRIIHEMKDQEDGGAEHLEDLIDSLHRAEDEVRETAHEAQLRIHPRPVVNFPDRRSVMDTLILVLKEETEERLGITGEPDVIRLTPRDIRSAAPSLHDLVPGVVHFGRYEENAGGQLAVETLRNLNRQMAKESLGHLGADEMRALRLANITRMSGEETARTIMNREFPLEREPASGPMKPNAEGEQ